MSEKKRKNTNSDIWIAGAFAAFSVDLLVYPLDTLKTRIQSPDYKRLFVNESTNTLQRGVLFKGLYQGLGSIILVTLPASGAFFTTYEGAKSIFTRHNSNLSSRSSPLFPQALVHSTASALAELISCAILTPAEVIKQNAQMVSSPSPTGPSATTQTLQRFRGNPLALWRGYGALAARNLPFTALQFPMFEQLKETLVKRRKRMKGIGASETLSLWESGCITSVAAGSAGAVAAVVTTPVDVVKTRIMLAAPQGDSPSSSSSSTSSSSSNVTLSSDPSRTSSASSKPGKIVDAVGIATTATKRALSERKSSLTIAKEVVADQGWQGLFRGGLLRAGWTMLGSGLYLGMYETGRVYLERRRDGEED